MSTGTHSPPMFNRVIGLGLDAPADDAAVAALTRIYRDAGARAWWLHGRPRWRLYAVTDEATIAGGGCLYTDGTSAWLGMGSVLQPYRRRGGQRALMARRIDDAVAPAMAPRYCMNHPWLTTCDCPVSAIVAS